MKLKQTINRVNTSIKSKLFVFLAIIVGLLILINSYVFFFVRQFDKMYEQTLMANTSFKEVYVELSNTKALVLVYRNQPSIQGLNEFNKAYPLLLEKAADFEEIAVGTEVEREAKDLMYMVQSFVEEANSTIIFQRENEYSKARLHYQNMNHQYTLIQENFKSVFVALVEDSNNLKREVEAKRSNLFATAAISLALLIFICIYVAKRFSRSLISPIEELAAYAKKIEIGNIPKEKIAFEGNDEFQTLSHAFNEMIDRINTQIVEISKKADIERKLIDEERKNMLIESELKQTELKMLQSMVNPHFLFNSINLIGQVAYIENAQKTSHLIESLSALLRYNIDNYGEIVHLDEEISIIREYIYIQEKRFGQRINFVLEFDESLADNKIPCLTIQPLIENAIIHGVKDVLENAIIKTSVTRCGDRIKILVEDNGGGISKQKIKELFELIDERDADQESNGIGIMNVYSRLNIFYDGNVEIDIDSSSLDGTKIELLIPIRE